MKTDCCVVMGLADLVIGYVSATAPLGLFLANSLIDVVDFRNLCFGVLGMPNLLTGSFGLFCAGGSLEPRRNVNGQRLGLFQSNTEKVLWETQQVKPG